MSLMAKSVHIGVNSVTASVTSVENVREELSETVVARLVDEGAIEDCIMVPVLVAVGKYLKLFQVLREALSKTGMDL